MKYLLLGILLFSSMANASGKGGFNEQEQIGIITPDIATGFNAYTRYAYNVDGSGMSVCEETNWGLGGSCKKWTSVTQLIPPGRRFVGFRVVSGAYGHRQLEIFWK